MMSMSDADLTLRLRREKELVKLAELLRSMRLDEALKKVDRPDDPELAELRKIDLLKDVERSEHARLYFEKVTLRYYSSMKELSFHNSGLATVFEILLAVFIALVLALPFITVFMPDMLGTVFIGFMCIIAAPAVLSIPIFTMIVPEGGVPQARRDSSLVAPILISSVSLVLLSIPTVLHFVYFNMGTPEYMAREYSNISVIISLLLGLGIAISVSVFSHYLAKRYDDPQTDLETSVPVLLLRQSLDVLLVRSRMAMTRIALGFGVIVGFAVISCMTIVKSLVYIGKVLMSLSMGTVKDLDFVNVSAIIPPSVLALILSISLIAITVLASIGSSRLNTSFSMRQMFVELRNRVIVCYLVFFTFMLFFYPFVARIFLGFFSM
jgi:hypothetical protein